MADCVQSAVQLHYIMCSRSYTIPHMCALFYTPLQLYLARSVRLSAVSLRSARGATSRRRAVPVYVRAARPPPGGARRGAHTRHSNILNWILYNS